MGYGLTRELLFLGVCVYVACALIASRELPTPTALLLALVRVAIPVGYFAWYFDGSWTLFDDFTYFHQGKFLLDNGYSPLSILTPQGVDLMHGLAGSRHILYVWWNLLAVWLFGAEYYAPVVVNILVTFVAGHLLVQLLKEIGLEDRYRRFLYVFYLLHWQTIAWSSFVNLKDSIVQVLTIALFLFGARCVRRQSWRYGVACLAVAQLLSLIRFYVPVLVAGAALPWVVLEWRDSRKYILLGGAAFVGLMILPRYMHRLHQMNPTVIVYGAVHYLLTPQPWAVLPRYSFLEIPSLCHWMMFLPALGGAFLLWRESRIARLILIYCGVLVLFYSLADDLRGVRQRSQISFVFAWTQMHFLWRWRNAPATATSRVNPHALPHPTSPATAPAYGGVVATASIEGQSWSPTQ